MRIIKIFGKYIAIHILNELQYRANFLIQLFYSMLSLAFSLATLQLIFYRVEALNGWSREEIFLLVGVYYIIQGLINLVISSSLSSFMGSVGSGSFDFTLLKPVDAQFLSATAKVQMWRVVDIIMGIVIIFYVLMQFKIQITFIQMVEFVFLLILGVTILSSLYMIIATSAFWFIGVAALLAIFPQCFEWAGRWPVKVYPNWLRYILTFIIPVGLAITIPAEILLGKLDPKMIFLSIVLTITFLGIARIIWKLGLRKYSGASS